MAPGDAFRELLLRVRSGDSDAAYELVRQYESDIRVAVRTRLSDPSLRRQFDSMDVCQSVLASFFLRAGAGQFDLSSPGQLVALLTRMAHNKLAMRARSQYRQRRDVRRTSSEDQGSGRENQMADPGATPSEIALQRDLLDRALALMDPAVREIAELRTQGMDWNEIAGRLGGEADARRKQFARAIDRIASRLDVE
jgi:RNA polymerase sigma-70 factor (ECF subfamily)